MRSAQRNTVCFRGRFSAGKTKVSELMLDFGPGIEYNKQSRCPLLRAVPTGRPFAGRAGREMPVCRNGRRGGLKIPCANHTCGFDPHHRHQNREAPDPKDRGLFLFLFRQPRLLPKGLWGSLRAFGRKRTFPPRKEGIRGANPPDFQGPAGAGIGSASRRKSRSRTAGKNKSRAGLFRRIHRQAYSAGTCAE